MNMKKNIIKKEDKIYSAGEVMSMIESFSDGMQVIAEGQSELVKKFDGLEGRFDGLEVRFDGLERKFDTMQEDISEIKYKLNKKVDYEDFEKLEKKFYKLEKLVMSKI